MADDTRPVPPPIPLDLPPDHHTRAPRPGVNFLLDDTESKAASPSPSTGHRGSQSPQARRKSRDDRRRSRQERRASEVPGQYHDSRASTRDEYRRRASTLKEYYASNPDLLPQLPYTMRHGRRRFRVIALAFFMVLDACILPILLYYTMKYVGNVEEWIIFAIVATIWGGPTYLEFAIRSFRLISKKSNFYRPLDASSRWCFDITHYIGIFVIVVVTALLCAGSAPHHPWIRVLGLPGPALLLSFGGPMFIQTLYAWKKWPAPFRVSSTPKGGHVRPGVYTFVEDVVAVNGGAGRPYREALDARYNASKSFRILMIELSWFWSIGTLVVGSVLTVLVCVHAVHKDVAYGIGWAVPFIWAGIWTLITIPWVQRALDKEEAEWGEIHHGVPSGILPEV